MFTGIIEEIGTVINLNKSSDSAEIHISAQHILEDVQLGDSIAVNGLCLTVTSFDASGFTADIMPVTLEKSSLNDIQTGDKVNLERALQLKSRLGGHLVSGHIDAVGTIISKTQNENAVLFEISANLELTKYLIPEGSICVDGISLTIARLTDTGFVISIIPHTIEQTILQYKQEGDRVNLESDVIGKYIYNFLNRKSSPETQQSKISRNFLTEHGFV